MALSLPNAAADRLLKPALYAETAIGEDQSRVNTMPD